MKAPFALFRILTIIAIIATFGQLMPNMAISQDWFDSEWQFRRPVIIENTGTTDLSEYQVMFNLDGSFDFNKTNPDGSDIMLTEDDGITLLPFWIESWDPGATNATIWLKAPNISITGSTVYMYYGNPGPVITPPAPVEVPPTGPFLKDPGNPIIPIGDPGNGESLLAENIVYDDVTGHYWLLFAAYRGGQALGLAWSDNPTDPAAWNWEGYVISDANAPHIIKSGGTWYIFYADRGHGGPPYPISVSSSPNVNGPYTYIGTVLESTEAWESYRVDEPYVLQRNDGKWILMYMGDPGTTEEQIGYAEADDILGPYTKFAGNPCLTFGPPGSFDAGTIADPWVYEYYGVYYIGYTVSPTTSSPWQTAMAYTSDWSTFTKNGIILPLGSEYNSFRGAVTRIGDTYVFPYTTKITSESTYQMAIATQPVYMTPPSPINNNIAVFDFIDDFDGTSLDPYKWYFANGDIAQTSVQNGLLNLTGVTEYVKLLGTSSFGMDYLFEAKAYHPDHGTEGLIAEVGFSDIQWNALRIVDDFPSITHWQRQAKLFGEPDEFIDMAQTADPDWHTFRIYRSSPNIAGFQIDDNPIETTTGTTNTSVPTMELPPYLMSYGETNQFVIDWARVRKWSGEDSFTTVGTEQNFTNGIDIAIYNTSCGNFEVRLKPDVDLSDNTISNIQFTLKWPINTLNLFDFTSNYDVSQQGPVITENDTNFAVFVSSTPIAINWTAETEYTILSFAHDQVGSGYTDLLIDTGPWSLIHNGAYYVELLGFDETGVVYQNLNNIFLGECGRLDIKVFLEGPYNPTSSLMTTDLNISDHLPLNQPFNNPPWNYNGNENIILMPTGVVDWILIELRDAPNPASATSTTQIHKEAALLLNDGSIVGSDGISLLDFNNATLTNLFVTLWHRNHLGILSGTNVIESPADNYSFDFTADASQAYLNGQIQMEPDIYGMYGGDANSDGIIDFLDIYQIWVPQVGTQGYLNGDMNLDIQVNNPDKNDIWFWNLNNETQVPD